jgi:hypothetical protein
LERNPLILREDGRDADLDALTLGGVEEESRGVRLPKLASEIRMSPRAALSSASARRIEVERSRVRRVALVHDQVGHEAKDISLFVVDGELRVLAVVRWDESVAVGRWTSGPVSSFGRTSQPCLHFLGADGLIKGCRKAEYSGGEQHCGIGEVNHTSTWHGE